MTIGVFAQHCGLTASALRFYADSGLLPPAEVDAVTGYRFYDPIQIERAVLVRRLREIGMPLDAVKSAIDADPVTAAGLADTHLELLVGDAAIARERVAAIKTALTGAPSLEVASLSGPIFAAAIDQVLDATACEPGMAVLDGVRFESGPESVVLTATDRYRLATRTIVAESAAPTTWAATLHAGDLRQILPTLRRSPRLVLAASPLSLVLRSVDGGERHCRLLADPYPDFRGMIARLPEPGTRVVVNKTALLRAMETTDAVHLLVNATSKEIALRSAADQSGSEVRIPAAATGPEADVGFHMTTLYPAISSAIGADLIIDLRGPSAPATIRSADTGDLTTLAMPAIPNHSEYLDD